MTAKSKQEKQAQREREQAQQQKVKVVVNGRRSIDGKDYEDGDTLEMQRGETLSSMMDRGDVRIQAQDDDENPKKDRSAASTARTFGPGDEGSDQKKETRRSEKSR